MAIAIRNPQRPEDLLLAANLTYQPQSRSCAPGIRKDYPGAAQTTIAGKSTTTPTAANACSNYCAASASQNNLTSAALATSACPNHSRPRSAHSSWLARKSPSLDRRQGPNRSQPLAPMVLPQPSPRPGLPGRPPGIQLLLLFFCLRIYLCRHPRRQSCSGCPPCAYSNGHLLPNPDHHLHAIAHTYFHPHSHYSSHYHPYLHPHLHSN